MNFKEAYFQRIVEHNELYFRLVVAPSLENSGWSKFESSTESGHFYKKKMRIITLPVEHQWFDVVFAFKPQLYSKKSLSHDIYEVRAIFSKEQTAVFTGALPCDVADLLVREGRFIHNSFVDAMKRNKSTEDMAEVTHSGDSLFYGRASFPFWLKYLDDADLWSFRNYKDILEMLNVSIPDIDKLTEDAIKLDSFKKLKITRSHDTVYRCERGKHELEMVFNYQNATHELCHYLIANGVERKQYNYGLEDSNRDDVTHFNYTREFATVLLHDYLIKRGLQTLPAEKRDIVLLTKNYLFLAELWKDFFYEAYLTSSENLRTYRAAERKVKSFINKTPESELDALSKLFLHLENE